LKVVIPANPYDAKGMLISAIRDNDPIMFMEPKRIYRSAKGEVPEGEYTVPLGKAAIAKEGKDLTLVSWGAMVHEALDAAKLAAEKRHRLRSDRPAQSGAARSGNDRGEREEDRPRGHRSRSAEDQRIWRRARRADQRALLHQPAGAAFAA